MRYLLALLLTVTPAFAHDWYPGWCCSGKDCGPLKDGTVKETDKGWEVIGPKGNVIFVPYGQPGVMVVPAEHDDGKTYHGCFYPDVNTIRCFYYPGKGV